MYSNNSTQKLPFSLQPRPAWNAIFVLIFVTLISLIAGHGSISAIIFVLTSFGVGLFLYFRYPAIYVSYSLWLVFVGHLIGRLYSYRAGYNVTGPASSSAIVIFICVTTFLQKLPRIIKNRDQVGIALILCISSITYSYLIRCIVNPARGSIQSEIILLISTIAPPLLCFYLYSHWQNYPKFRNNIYTTFLWSSIVMGGYGIFQFFVAPGWDTQWMVGTEGEQESWIGRPEPLSIRVFSTMWDPYGFSLNLMPSLILLFTKNDKLRYIALVLGLLSFLLSTYRTAWYTFAIALLVFLTSIKSNRQIRIFMSLILIAIIIFLIINSNEAFLSIIGERFNTFSNLGDDASGQARAEQVNQLFGIAMTEIVGKGLNVGDIVDSRTNLPTNLRLGNYDMGFLQLPLNMGWIGTIPYLIGVALLVPKFYGHRHAHIDPFTAASKAIVIASLIRVVSSSILLGGFSFPLWIFMGIGMASYKYYKRKLQLVQRNMKVV
jgi:hypothetical protein